jgi:hypothetical protein
MSIVLATWSHDRSTFLSLAELHNLCRVMLAEISTSMLGVTYSVHQRCSSGDADESKVAVHEDESGNE